MSTKRASEVDLTKVFNTVTRELKNNQQALNASDAYNHNHGDNMVENFQTITSAMRETKDCTPSEQLAHASQVLSQRSQTGSAQLYSQGLANAAEQLRGQSLITSENAMLLVQALMGGQPAAQQSQPAQQNQGNGMDLLGSLLGGMSGESQGQAAGGDLLSSLLGGMTEQPQSQAQGGDLLGNLLGSVLGGGESGQTGQAQPTQAGGIDLNMLLAAGMAFFQARQQGAEPLQALVQAVMAGSQMQGSAHHSQSGQMVAQTLISSLGSMLSGNR